MRTNEDKADEDIVHKACSSPTGLCDELDSNLLGPVAVSPASTV